MAERKQRCRVLVVEDQVVVALDLVDQLEQAGFEAVGPVTSVANALGLIRTTVFDAAVLDVHLGSETSEEVALELHALGKPFVVVSGYSADSIRAQFGDVPVLGKPTSFQELETALTKMME